MLISPQHLQQADLYHERLLDRRLAALAPQTWGILSLEVGSGRAGGRGVAGEPLCRHLARRPLPGLRGRRSRGPGRASDWHALCSVPSPCSKYFSLCPRSATGFPASRPRAVRPRLRFAARDSSRPPGRWAISRGSRLTCPSRSPGATSRCCSATRPRDDFDSIKIAEIVRNASGSLLASEAFIPSVLTIAASPFLCSSVRRLLALMTAKQRHFPRSGGSAMP